MASISNFVFLLLIIFTLILTATSRINNQKQKSFLQTKEELKEKKEQEKINSNQKEIEREFKAIYDDDWDNHSITEVQLSDFLTQVSDTIPDYLTSVKSEEKKTIKQDPDSIWKLTALDKFQDSNLF